MNGDPIIAHVLFTDGARRAVYQEASGKQYVLDDGGRRFMACGISRRKNASACLYRPFHDVFAELRG
jgi:hypothetical protein